MNWISDRIKTGCCIS